MNTFSTPENEDYGIPCSKFKFADRELLLRLRLFEDMLPGYVQERIEEALVE